MNSQSTAFDYDEFEQYLLNAARVDQAPADLPARLGVALGLGVPVLVATEAASLIPTTSPVSTTSAATLGKLGVPTNGLLAAVKTALGVGASTLWNTAAKGIAVGLISGGAFLGTTRAVVWMASSGTGDASAKAFVSETDHLVARANAAPPRVVQVQEASPPLAANFDAAADEEPSSVENAPKPTGAASAANFYKYRAPMSWVSSVGNAPTPDSEADKPVKRRARRIFPEKTTAIARYPLLFDDVSAYYDTPKRSTIAHVQAPAVAEATIDPAELAAMRAKAIQRARTLLGQSKAPLALDELDHFRTRVGDRNFGVDELLLRIEALAIMGRAKEAQVDVASVERLAPNSAALRQAQQLARSRFVR